MTADLSGTEVSALRELLDQAAIREVLIRYFYLIDTRRRDDMAALFTVDAEIRYAETGGAGDSALAERAPIGRGRPIAQTTHTGMSTDITVKGDTAEVDTFTIHVHMYEARDGEDGRALVRGTRYQDELVRTADGWRIRRRTHKTLWQFEADTVPPRLL